MTDVQTLSAFGTWYRRSYPNSPLTDEQVAMLDVFRGTVTGLYNLYRAGAERSDGGFQPLSDWGVKVLLRGELSSFDDSSLTFLVVNAHRLGLRVAISAQMNYLKVQVTRYDWSEPRSLQGLKDLIDRPQP